MTHGLRRGNLALVTGASSGIGETFATVLAERGLHLVLTARSEDRLRSLAADLTARHGVRVNVIPLDLAERDGPERLFAATERLGLMPDILVNNAGVGAPGAFAELDLEQHLQLVRVNVEALVALARLYLPAMLARRSGGIINVGSTAAFQPVPYLALYGASKAFVVSLSAALWTECRGSGVHVTAVCPGLVAETRFGRVDMGNGEPEEHATVGGVPSSWLLPRRRVVETALAALVRGDPVVVPGTLNALGAALIPLVPLRLLLAIAERVLRRRVPRERHRR